MFGGRGPNLDDRRVNDAIDERLAALHPNVAVGITGAMRRRARRQTTIIIGIMCGMIGVVVVWFISHLL
jgi:threonine dehydrogenase-like Zn-dependent dehydrogenase